MRDTTREANHSIYDLTYSAIVDLLRLSQKESNWCKIGLALSKGGGYFSKALIRLAGLPITVELSETLANTTEPEATVTSFPMLTPCSIVELEPIKVLLPT